MAADLWHAVSRRSVGATTSAVDKLGDARERAVSLYLKQLTDPKADKRLRASALSIAADARVHTHPKIRPVIQKVKPDYAEADVPEVAAMGEAWRANFEYFRKWVAPELTRANREDEFSCLGCHGVAGRVPSMELLPADGNGYLSAKALYTNYVTLLDRINEHDVENSKILRKPLNVQVGQGGRPSGRTALQSR